MVFLASAGLCLLAGVAALRDGRADWDAVLALSHAFDVVFKEPRFNLGLMGFSSPPLPTLLYLPLCGFTPSLAVSGLACPILGAVCLGGTGLMLDAMAARSGLPWFCRWPLVAVVVLHPLVLSLAALGSPGCVLVLALLGAAWSLVRWSETDNLRYLLQSALFLTAAILTRYEAFWLVLTATAYVAWRSYRRSGGWARVEGTLIAFLLPVVYSAGVWMGANWAIMGDPWHFWRTGVVEQSGDALGLDAWAVSLVWAVLLAFPILPALVFHEVRSRPQAMRDEPCMGRPAAWLVVGVLLGALASPGLHSASRGGTWSAVLCPALASVVIGAVLLAAVLGQYVSGRRRVSRHLPIGAGVLLLMGIAGALWLWLAGKVTLPASTAGALGGDVAFAADVSGERAAAKLVGAELAAGQTAHVLGWPGYALSLFSGRPAQIVQYPPTPPGRLPLCTGDLLVLYGTTRVEDVQRALEPRCLQAEPLGSGTWTTFRIVGATPGA